MTYLSCNAKFITKLKYFMNEFRNKTRMETHTKHEYWITLENITQKLYCRYLVRNLNLVNINIDSPTLGKQQTNKTLITPLTQIIDYPDLLTH